MLKLCVVCLFPMFNRFVQCITFSVATESGKDAVIKLIKDKPQIRLYFSRVMTDE